MVLFHGDDLRDFHPMGSKALKHEKTFNKHPKIFSARDPLGLPPRIPRMLATSSHRMQHVGPGTPQMSTDLNLLTLPGAKPTVPGPGNQVDH